MIIVPFYVFYIPQLQQMWKEKEENAVQEQSPEEVPSLAEAEDGEEVGEEDPRVIWTPCWAQRPG